MLRTARDPNLLIWHRRPWLIDHGAAPFQYAVVRVVPKVERGEGFNAGVIVFCRPRRFLAARVHLDEALLAALSQPERFHWLVSPRSTAVQPAEVHTDMTADPEGTLAHLFAALVERPGTPRVERPRSEAARP